MKDFNDKLLAGLVKKFFPQFGYVAFDKDINTYLIGDGDFLMATVKVGSGLPMLSLRSSTKSTSAAILGCAMTLVGNFDFGECFEIDAYGNWIYGVDAEGLAADNIYKLWFDIDPPVDETGLVGFTKKSNDEKSEMN